MVHVRDDCKRDRTQFPNAPIESAAAIALGLGGQMDSSDWIGSLGAITGVAGVIVAFIALRRAGEANNIARESVVSQEASDRVSRSANLMPPWGHAGVTEGVKNKCGIQITLQNRGPVTAHNVYVEIRLVNGGATYRYGSRRHIEPNGDHHFGIGIDEALIGDDLELRLIDFEVTYEDGTGNHKKVFRVEVSGQLYRNWSFRLLDINLDGRPVPFPEAPKLAPDFPLSETAESV